MAFLLGTALRSSTNRHKPSLFRGSRKHACKLIAPIDQPWVRGETIDSIGGELAERLRAAVAHDRSMVVLTASDREGIPASLDEAAWAVAWTA